MSNKISKWGNSSGIRIPKSLMAIAGLSTDDEINLNIVNLDNGERGILIAKSNLNFTDFNLSNKELLEHIIELKNLIENKNKE